MSVVNIAALPKADLHLHAETDGRVDRILARRQGRAAFDWATWARQLQRETPPGFGRLEAWWAHHALPDALVDSVDAHSDVFVARVADAIHEAAADGAILVEVRFGAATSFRPDFMPLFREAELRVQRDFPRCRAEAIISGLSAARPERWEHVFARCLAMAREGLAGLDIIPDPYAAEADWRGVAQWTARAASYGLGITVHAGEFSQANIEAACALPGRLAPRPRGLRRDRRAPPGNSAPRRRDDRMLSVVQRSPGRRRLVRGTPHPCLRRARHPCDAQLR